MLVELGSRVVCLRTFLLLAFIGAALGACGLSWGLLTIDPELTYYIEYSFIYSPPPSPPTRLHFGDTPLPPIYGMYGVSGVVSFFVQPARMRACCTRSLCCLSVLFVCVGKVKVSSEILFVAGIVISVRKRITTME